MHILLRERNLDVVLAQHALDGDVQLVPERLARVYAVGERAHLEVERAVAESDEEDGRLGLAQHEWARLKANNSLECRNCHGFDYMDFTRQSPRAAQQHSTLLASGERTCIDCHKGISHKLPQLPLPQTSDATPRQ